MPSVSRMCCDDLLLNTVTASSRRHPTGEGKVYIHEMGKPEIQT